MGLSNVITPTDFNSDRIKWVDIAKGIGILLVILGHAPRLEVLSRYPILSFMNTFIYSFHMQFFFFLSGYVSNIHKRRPYKGVLKKKIATMIIPWMTYGLAIYTFFFFANQIPILKSVLQGTSYELVSIKEYIWLSLASDNPYSYHLWFIFVLFWIQIIVETIKAVFGKIGKEHIFEKPSVLWGGGITDRVFDTVFCWST